MRLRHSFLAILILLTVAQTISAQALDISSGGQPTITGAVNGSITGSASVLNDLVVTINFGEVSPAQYKCDCKGGCADCASE